MSEQRIILLTGGSGNLGQAIIASGRFPGIMAPSHENLDITNEKAVADFFRKTPPEAIIHCAAVVRMVEPENDPVKAIDANIIGTCNLVKETIRTEKRNKKTIRFIYVSTDGVYPGTRGNYFERDLTIPYNKYGWSKLGGECAVNLLSNFCIIRTSFFNPRNIKHDSSATDKYSSRLPVDYLPQAIAFLLREDFIGTINVGGKRESEYDRYRKFKPSLKACKYEDIVGNLSYKLARDASLNSFLWQELSKGEKELELDE